MNKFLAGLLALALMASSAVAQAPSPGPVAVLAGQVPLNLTNASARVALPSTAVSASAITVYNKGTKDAYFALGSVTVTATTASTQIAAGTAVTLWKSSNTYLAGITSGADTTSLVIYQATGPVNFAGGASSSGGGGGSGAVTVAGGADVTEGTIGDTQATGTVVGFLKSMWSIFNATPPATSALQTTGNSSLSTIVTNTGAATPAGTAIIGKVGIDQTTPGTTNNVTLSTNVGTLPVVQATATIPITFTAAGGPTQIIAASGATKIYITHWDVVLSGAGTFALVTGTGSNCGTSTTYLTGASGHPLSFGANGGISAGSGLGPVLITGASGAVCAITTGAVDSSGSIAYAQF